ncbi:hypothetical protein BDN72DRAFT_375843 [Pluteus cervinus]|uniref:Uncharacterized protein n=1 Tax=Pluteus cervinus TaxID=181527 RepID=A0ACD3ABI0_9AGAR|nr:hypothetical protein BDN72DRAFT_375843 [Pluteus cervinus]
MMSKQTAAAEIANHIVGPMKADEFLDTFMPGSQTISPSPDTFAGVTKATREDEMYGPWVSVLTSTCGNKIVHRDTHNDRISDQDGCSFGPDVTTYPHGGPHKIPDKCDLSRAEVLHEFKFDPSVDPFDDESEGFERVTDAAKETLGQITLSAIAHLGMQFRTHVFSVLVFPKYARLLRWDRAGVVVTEKIDLSAKGHMITTFFRRLGDASKSVRGVDDTVNPVSNSRSNIEAIRQALNVTRGVPLFEVKVDGRTFIIAEPTFFSASSVFGRSTRCYRAYHVDGPRRNRVYNFKDTWRIWTPNRLNEYQVLLRLQKAGVWNIPIPMCGDDVTSDKSPDNHRTRTQDYANADWVKTPIELRTFQHFRLVTDVLDLHLEECTTVEAAVTVVRDASIAHEDACKAGYIHRDVSWANIMAKVVDGQLRGILLDWDMCQELDETKLSKDKCDQVPERTGTWYFIAARLIVNEGLPLRQTRLDDIESFFHVLVYLAALFTEHIIGSTEVLTLFFRSYFQELATTGGQETGGRYKISFLRTNGDDLIPKLENVALRTILLFLVSALQERYPTETKNLRTMTVITKPKEDQTLPPMLAEVENNPHWLSENLTKALDDFDDEHWTLHGALVRQKPPRPAGAPPPGHQSMSNRAMRNVTKKGQKYKDGLLRPSVKKVEKQRDGREGHTKKKRRLV